MYEFVAQSLTLVLLGQQYVNMCLVIILGTSYITFKIEINKLKTGRAPLFSPNLYVANPRMDLTN